MWLMLLSAAPSWAVTVDICYNYDCSTHANVRLTSTQMRDARELFNHLNTPRAERDAIALALGLFAGYAAQQTPTGNDKGGNVNDGGVDGRMDCIDHAHNTTAYLQLLKRFGFLRFHEVLPPVERAPLLFNAHWSAQVMEYNTEDKFVVDTWFRDNGAPAVIFPLDKWLQGASPDE
ncbi:MAG: hypothetical protein ABL868_03505 [Sulfuriferula sp.]